MLSLSKQVTSIHEPFNPNYPRSWLRHPPKVWFEYNTEDATSQRHREMWSVLNLRPPIGNMARRSLDPRHAVRVTQEALGATRARRRSARALVKDPIAFFSAPWIHESFDARVVVLTRHPAAFASSLKRLRWSFDFDNLDRQKALMETLPSADARAIHAARRRQPDIIDSAILLWCVFNNTALRYRDRYSDFILRRYEDLASHPKDAFKDLYSQLDLEWTAAVEASVEAHTHEDNPAWFADDDKGGIVRDSIAAMWTWTNRLTADEVARVRAGTMEAAAHCYGDRDWQPGPQR